MTLDQKVVRAKTRATGSRALSLKVVPALWVYQGSVGRQAARVRCPNRANQSTVKL
jgi:hypothetical protein